MSKVLLAVALVSLLVLLAEYFYRIKHYQSEFTRKFVHITVGSFAAFWPWFLSWQQIEYLSLLFLVVIGLSRLLSVLSSIHLIGRKTVGEIFFAVAIGLTAILTHNRYIFMAAMLHLSLADGLAAIAGTYFGRVTRYKIFHQHKSIVGTEAFYMSSLAILAVYFHLSHATGSVATLLWLPILTTALENIGIQGIDNLLVPVAVTLVLRLH